MSPCPHCGAERGFTEYAQVVAAGVNPIWIKTGPDGPQYIAQSAGERRKYDNLPTWHFVSVCRVCKEPIT